jgi:NOL1/NOP2/fmu family ribosome biogenesis protein
MQRSVIRVDIGLGEKSFSLAKAPRSPRNKNVLFLYQQSAVAWMERSVIRVDDECDVMILFSRKGAKVAKE